VYIIGKYLRRLNQFKIRRILIIDSKVFKEKEKISMKGNFKVKTDEQRLKIKRKLQNFLK